MNEKATQKLYSVRLMMLIIVILIPMNLITLIMSAFAIRGLVSQMRENTQGVLEVYLSRIESDLTSGSTRSRFISSESQSFLYFSRLRSPEDGTDDDKMHATVKLYNEYGDFFKENNTISGMYSIYPQADLQVIRDNRYSYSMHKDAMKGYLDRRLTEERNMGKWEFCSVGDEARLFYMSKYRQSYFGAWYDLDDLIRELGMADEGEWLLFLDEDGQVLYRSSAADDWQADRVDPAHPVLEKGMEAVAASSSLCGMTVIRGVSVQRVLRAFPLFLRIMLGLSVIGLLALPVIISLMKRWIIRPVRKLNDAMEEISRGNMDYRIEESESGSEFDRMNHEFNRMMEEVSNLKINVYEEQLEKQDIRLKFLSQQIQPHFILNTLTILYSYEQNEYPLIQKMILCLSRYFRYIVNANRDEVPLRAEMDHIRNYFEIQQARYPDTFFAFVEYDDSIASCLVPPLLIQNFAENSIKHSIKIGNQINIFVIAQPLGEDRIRIRMLDTGQGIDQELIERINEFRRTGERQKGLGIGIQNAIERLNVLYGADTQFEITRDEPHGTRIEIILPRRQGEEAEEE